jgi:hypothetical protein
VSAAASERELRFESRNFRVWHRSRPSDTVVVTFDFWEPGRTDFGKFLGGSLMDASGWAHVHVATRLNNWFLAPETDALIDAVARVVADYGTVTTHGNSMGGYAALLMGGRIGAARAIAISPQFSVDPAKAPFDTRWQADLPNIDFTWDRLAEWSGDLRHAQILYDPRMEIDRRHVDMLVACAPHWQAVPLAFSGHPSLGVFREAGVAAQLIQQLLSEDVSVAEIVRFYKAHRRQSTIYFERLARLAGRREALFDWVVAQALTRPRVHVDTLFKLSQIALAREAHGHGLKLLDRAQAHAKNPTPWLEKQMRQMRKTLLARL